MKALVGGGAVLVTSIAVHAQQMPPTNLVANEAIMLRATTPLGPAGVEIEAGTILTNYEIQGDQVKIWRGPFFATVDLAGVQPVPPPPTPEPSATPTPLPLASNIPAATATAPESPATPAAPSTPEATPPANFAAGLERLPWWIPQAAAAVLAIYALFSTLALLRARRRAATVTPTKTEKPPVITVPKPGAAKPAVVSDGGNAIACPLCHAKIPLEKLLPGRNDCPSCRGRFICE